MAPPSADRAHLLLRLTGGDHADGEIPLDRMADIARHTQELLLRLGRGLSGREGAGRTPGDLSTATRFLLVGLGPGSTTLDIAGPPLEAELDLGEDLAPSATHQAVHLLGDSLEGTARDDAPLPDLPAIAAASFDRWLDALQSYERLMVSLREHDGRSRVVDLSPIAARTRLRRKREHSSPASEPTPVTRWVEGELYAVNLRTGRFRLEDDIGNSIQLSMPSALVQGVGPMIGQRVRAGGMAETDREGLIKELTVAEFDLAERGLPTLEGRVSDDHDDFHERLEQAEELSSIEEFAMDNLDDEEVDAFWAAIEEARGG